VTLADVLRAKRRIQPFVRRTALAPSAWLSDLTGSRVMLKLESLQVSNSFKSRGAFNAVARRAEEQPGRRPLVTASAGNHGRALAAAAEVFGFPLTVFTPRDAPRTKTDAIRRHGATLKADGRDYDAAEKLALACARDSGADFISPYNDIDVIAGAATVALEIFEDAPDVDTLVVPIGGGGLAAGVAAAIKQSKPDVVMVGVEPVGAAKMKASIEAGHPITLPKTETIADGLMPVRPGDLTFAHVREYVDEIRLVTDLQIADAVLWLFANAKIVAEPSGAATVAAALVSKPRLPGLVVAIVSGGNMGLDKLEDLRRLAR